MASALGFFRVSQAACKTAVAWSVGSFRICRIVVSGMPAARSLASERKVFATAPSLRSIPMPVPKMIRGTMPARASGVAPASRLHSPSLPDHVMPGTVLSIRCATVCSVGSVSI